MKNPFQNRKQLFAASKDMRPVVTLAWQRDGLAVILARLEQAQAQRVDAERAAGHLLITCIERAFVVLLRRLTGIRLKHQIGADRAASASVQTRLRSAAATVDSIGDSDCTTTTVNTGSCDGESMLRPKASVLILARFAHLLPDSDRLNAYADRYPGLQISASTAHASKGLEADYVLILNMTTGAYGFPSERQSDVVLERFLPQPEQFEYADERRLFYVALTRARKHVWLLVPQDPKKMSIFVRELLSDNKAVVRLPGSRKIGAGSIWHAIGRRGSIGALGANVSRAQDSRAGPGNSAGDDTLADRQKCPISGVVDKIKRYIKGLGIGTEKKNRII